MITLEIQTPHRKRRIATWFGCWINRDMQDDKGITYPGISCISLLIGNYSWVATSAVTSAVRLA